MADSIKVICRFRPQNSREKKENGYMIVRVSDCHTLCEVTHPDKNKQPKPINFNFDCVFDWTSSQTEVFENSAKHLVEQVFDGYNATIFAYGQTGAGKTYSMEGKLGSPHRGIVPRTVELIFETIAEAENINMEYLLQVSYVEIYLEMLRDLLKPGNGKMKIRDGKTGVYIEGVTEMYVRDAVEVMELMEMGSSARTFAATNMNAVSSRSHGVFMLKLTQTNTTNGSKKASKLLMIDLAGSEKVSKSGATGQLLKEAQKINQSLSALGNVMAQLSEGKGHISYRDSVLTRLLSDSLGGNCKTTLLIACSPSSFNADETITTCRFGTRAKKIKNKAKINAEKTVAEYKVEVAELNARILQLQTLVKALRYDLDLAKKGEMTTDDQGKSDVFMSQVDMAFVMDDGKKKKKKTKKKKGFFKAGFDPSALGLDAFGGKKKTKKKKSKKTGDDNDDNDNKDDNKDDDDKLDILSASSSQDMTVPADILANLKDAEERADKAEQHIQYLEAELIKAQAAAATGIGLADALPPPSPRKRMSILPAPHRPRSSLLPKSNTTPTLAGSGSGSKSNNLLTINENNKSDNKNDNTDKNDDIPDDLPSWGPSTSLSKSKSTSKSIRRDLDFEMATAGTSGMDYVPNTVEITKMQMPQHLADLDPALLEQARRILQQENYDLRKQMEQLVHELDQSRLTIQKKTQMIKLQKHKTEDAEMECDRLLLQLQVLEERVDAFQDDRKRERKEIDNFKKENRIFKKEIEALKLKIQSKDKEIQDTIKSISVREAKRADEFIQQAIKQFKKLKQTNSNNKINQSIAKQKQNNINGMNGSGYNMRNQSITQQQKEINRQRHVMGLQMERLKQATYEQLEKIQFEQMRLNGLLETKTQQYCKLQMIISDKDDEIIRLNNRLKQKDVSLHRQATELKAFGDLKIKSDQIHQKEFKKAQDTIFDLKKMLTKLQRMNNDHSNISKSSHSNVALNHKRQVMPIRIKGGSKANDNKPKPLKGGSKGKNKPQPLKGGQSHKPAGQSQTSQFFNNTLRNQLLPAPHRGGLKKTSSANGNNNNYHNRQQSRHRQPSNSNFASSASNLINRNGYKNGYKNGYNNYTNHNINNHNNRNNNNHQIQKSRSMTTGYWG